MADRAIIKNMADLMRIFGNNGDTICKFGGYVCGFTVPISSMQSP